MLKIRNTCSPLIGVLVALACSGCGPAKTKLDASVEGTVTIDDELAKSGTVTFFPKGKGPAAVGRIFENGSYTVRVGQGDVNDPDRGKLPSGEYVVTVVSNGPSPPNASVRPGDPPILGPRLTALKYENRSTTDLKFQVKPGRNVIVLNLESSASDPPEAEASEEDEDSAEGPAQQGEEGEEPSPKTSPEAGAESTESSSPSTEAKSEPAEATPSETTPEQPQPSSDDSETAPAADSSSAEGSTNVPMEDANIE
jgi:hypothetical protein